MVKREDNGDEEEGDRDWDNCGGAGGGAGGGNGGGAAGAQIVAVF